MRKHFLLLTALPVALLTLFTACNKEDALRKLNDAETLPPTEETAETLIPITIHFSSSRATKTQVMTSDEARVNTMDLIVFKLDTHTDEYLFENYLHLGSGNPVDIDVTPGNRKFFAVANVDTGVNLRTVCTYDDLLSVYTQLKNQRRNAFTMVGEVTEDVDVNTTDITLEMERVVSRIKIDKITNEITHPIIGMQDFEVRSIFLTGVCDKWNIRGRSDIAYRSFYGLNTFGEALKLGNAAVGNEEKTLVNNLIYKEYDNLVMVDNQQTVDLNISLYAMNHNDPDIHTYLFLEILIDGDPYFYPIKVADNLLRNTSYEIRELIIHNLGNPSDGDYTLDEDEMTVPEWMNIDEVDFEIQDWNVVLLGEDEDGVIEL